MQICQRLKEVREDRDLTQAELANIIGCSERQIIRWENGDAEMGINKLKTFCTYFHVSADYILGLPEDLIWPRRFR